MNTDEQNPLLATLAEQAVAEYMRSEKAAKKIADVAKNTCNAAISECLGGYRSEFKKQIDAAVSKALVLHGEIDLPSYNDAILKIVAQQVENCTRDAIEKQVAARMKSLLTPAPESIALSTLMEQYRDFLRDKLKSGDCSCGEERFGVSITKSDNGGFVYVYLDKSRTKDSRSTHTWDIRFGIYDERIFSLSFLNVDVEKTLFAGPFYGFERSLFQMKAAGTKITIDCTEDDIDTDYSL